ncbi:MinD/ParA family protein [Streptomyces sp. NBC_00291]|uniref:MinD/ParA family ATP-binding protein n=1 Tax=Streptomyces sp. NBC_00291 TaxID=2975704 RepID=UPI002255F8E6|nr:MinD/ParA family protein [Streptomyces sp. NBC_00291]MCX5153864.1 MinD/ParA family protein [Streptomyces sp. NBC_00291]
MSQDDWQGDVLRDLRNLNGRPGGSDAPGRPGKPTGGPPAASASPDTPPPAEPPNQAEAPGRDEPPGRDAAARALPTPAPAPAPAPRPLPTPVTMELPLPDELVRGKPLSGDSATRRTSRSLRRLVGSSATREVEEATRVAQALQQPLTTGRQIVVTSIRGGAGKTTVAALLGRTFAHYRQDPVLMLEADPALGTLPARLGVTKVRWTTSDVAQLIDPSMQLTDVVGYLVQLPDRGWLLPGSQGRVGNRLELAEYRSVMVALRRYFGITVVDCDTLPSELSRTALSAAQARVLVTPATVEGVTTTRSVLDWMVSLSRPRMLEGTVVVVAASSPHMTLDVAAAREHLQLGGVKVLMLPYDRHLAAGGPIRTDLLGQVTREAVTELAAEVLTRAMSRRSNR